MRAILVKEGWMERLRPGTQCILSFRRLAIVHSSTPNPAEAINLSEG